MTSRAIVQLQENPIHRPDQLGFPVPNVTHAIGSCIGTAEQVIAFEEGTTPPETPINISYPRFVLHPFYMRLRQKFEQVAERGDSVWIFPSLKAAQRCVDFVGEGRVNETRHGLYTVTLKDAKNIPMLDSAAKSFWQHTGLIISSRQAEAALLGSGPRDASEAKAKLKERISGLAGGDASDVYLYPSGMAAMFHAYCILTERAGNGNGAIRFPVYGYAENPVEIRYGCEVPEI